MGSFLKARAAERCSGVALSSDRTVPVRRDGRPYTALAVADLTAIKRCCCKVRPMKPRSATRQSDLGLSEKVIAGWRAVPRTTPHRCQAFSEITGNTAGTLHAIICPGYSTSHGS